MSKKEKQVTEENANTKDLEKEEKKIPDPIVMDENKEGRDAHPAYSIIPEQREIPIPGFEDTIKGKLCFLVEIEGEQKSFLSLREAKKFVTVQTKAWRIEQGISSNAATNAFNVGTMQTGIIKTVDRLTSYINKSENIKFADKKKILRLINTAIGTLKDSMILLETTTGVSTDEIHQQIEKHKTALAEGRKAKKDKENN